MGKPAFTVLVACDKIECIAQNLKGPLPQARIQGRSDWGDRPSKSYESNFIRHYFVQFGKQHSRYKAILLSIVLSQHCYEVYVISLTVVNP